MEEAKIRVLWKGHMNAITSYFERLFNEGINFDCTFAAEGRFIRGHQNLISACSPYLEQLLAIRLEKNQHPVLVLECSFKHLEQLINYMYRGEVNVPEAEISQFLQVAAKYKIRGLEGSIGSCKTGTSNSAKTTDTINMSSKSSPPTESTENDNDINENMESTLGLTIPPPPPPSIIPQSFIKSSLLPTSQILLAQNDSNLNSTAGSFTIPKIFTPSLSFNELKFINNNNSSNKEFLVSPSVQHSTLLNGNGLTLGVGAKKRKSSLITLLQSPNIIRKRGRGRPRKVIPVSSPIDQIAGEINVNNNYIPTPTSTQNSVINWINNENMENNTNSIVDKAAQITLNEPCLITISDEDNEPEAANSSKSPVLQSTLTNGHENKEENPIIKIEPESLNNNEQLIGSDEKRFKCDSCSKPYKYQNWLKFHIKHESTEKCSPKYICNLCGKKKRQGDSFQKHQSKCKGGKKKKPTAIPMPIIHYESEASKISFAKTIDDLINAAGAIDGPIPQSPQAME